MLRRSHPDSRGVLRGPREGGGLPKSVGKRRTDDKEVVAHDQKAKVKTLKVALLLMSEMDGASVVGNSVEPKTERSWHRSDQITDGIRSLMTEEKMQAAGYTRVQGPV